MLEGIKEYSFLHSGPIISKAIVKAIEKGVPGVGEFLKARCVVADHQLEGEFPSIKEGDSYLKRLNK